MRLLADLQPGQLLVLGAGFCLLRRCPMPMPIVTEFSFRSVLLAVQIFTCGQKAENDCVAGVSDQPFSTPSAPGAAFGLWSREVFRGDKYESLPSIHSDFLTFTTPPETSRQHKNLRVRRSANTSPASSRPTDFPHRIFLGPTLTLTAAASSERTPTTDRRLT